MFDLSQVPSNPDASMEMRLVFTAFAAQGYIVIGADYFGCGQSDLPDSYLVRQSTLWRISTCYSAFSALA